MKITTCIWVTTQFEAIHSWPNAPEKVAYLSHPHRHLFHVRVELEVQHDDREVEFILFKSAITEFCQSHFAGTPHHFSCEQMAKLLGFYVANLMTPNRKIVVSVSEDGENGATVCLTPELK